MVRRRFQRLGNPRATSLWAIARGDYNPRYSTSNMAPPPSQEPSAGPSEEALQSSARTRPRTRAFQAALASTPSTSASSGGPAESSLMGGGSTSSVPTSLPISSESDYSTPGTSKSPDERESSNTQKGKERCSIEIRIPTKGKGKEVYHGSRIHSMKSVGTSSQVLEIEDSDDEEYGYYGGPDTSRDAEVALRLQNEEYASVGQSFESSDFGFSNNRPFRARESLASSSKSQAESSKRARVITKRYRPSKKLKVVADSDEYGLSDVDMNEIVTPSDAAPPLKAESDFEDDAPLMNKKNASRGKYKAPSVVAKPSTEAESDFEDDTPVMTKKSAPRRKFKARAKFVAPPGLSDSEDDAPIASGRNSSRSKPKASLVKAESDLEDDTPIFDGGNTSRSRLKVDRIKAKSVSDSEDDDDDFLSLLEALSGDSSTSLSEDEQGSEAPPQPADSRALLAASLSRRAYRQQSSRRVKKERNRLEEHHPELKTMWKTLEDMPILKTGMAPQPPRISRQLKPFQRVGLAWMLEMEKTEWKGGLLGDEMGLGKTIQAVSLIMSDYPAKQPTLVLVPPVALMQWQSEISSYTDGTLKTFVFHGTNKEAKNITVKGLKAYDVIMMSYNSLESMYRRQEKGFVRTNGIHKEKSVIHAIKFHRAILDEAHCIKTRTTMTAKACFALKTEYRWCLTGTPLQNRIGELFSLVRFLNIRPFTSYLCKQCPCTTLEWSMDQSSRCSKCGHIGMQHVSLFNQELLNPIQKFGNLGPGHQAFKKLRLMTDRIMLRRLKRDHTDSMELPVKEIYVDRQFFGEEENDFANSIMTSGQRRFDTYVAQGVLLNNYANIFGLIMQMRQVADHPDLILKKNAEGGQNVLVCCICDEPAEDTVRSRCKHDFCRTCVSAYVRSTDEPDCPRCHIPLVIDLEQPEIEQDENLMKKSSIINRIKMENWTSSSKIELLVHELHKLRSDNASHKSIIFSQFTTMLQLIEWRLRRAGITTVMLDGSMTPAQRQASIDHFMTNVDVECFLVSLKAGGVALNLTEASRVFIVDPWWNPAAEWQSADRCHRIGQTRPCTITRLCIEDSVESRMVLIQEKKTSMIHSTVNADDKAMDTLTPQDMQFLFRGH